MELHLFHRAAATRLSDPPVRIAATRNATPGEAQDQHFNPHRHVPHYAKHRIGTEGAAAHLRANCRFRHLARRTELTRTCLGTSPCNLHMSPHRLCQRSKGDSGTCPASTQVGGGIVRVFAWRLAPGGSCPVHGDERQGGGEREKERDIISPYMYVCICIHINK